MDALVCKHIIEDRGHDDPPRSNLRPLFDYFSKGRDRDTQSLN